MCEHRARTPSPKDASARIPVRAPRASRRRAAIRRCGPRSTAALRPFCPQQSGSIVVGIAPEKNARTKGTWRAQLFRTPISDEALRDKLEKRDTEKRQRALRYVCGHCTRVFLVCRLDGDSQCTAKCAACLQSVGVNPDDCERGGVPRPPKPKTQQPWDAQMSPPSEGGARVRVVDVSASR